MNHKEDGVIDWGSFNEHDMPIEAEIARTTQAILVLSQNIAIIEEGEGILSKIPRREELLNALKRQLDYEYTVLDRQNKVKALKDLDISTYHPPVRKSRVRGYTSGQPMGGIADLIQDMIDSEERRRKGEDR